MNFFLKCKQKKVSIFLLFSLCQQWLVMCRSSLYNSFSHGTMSCHRLQGNKDLFICGEITKAKVNNRTMGPKDDKKTQLYICFIQEALNRVIHLSTTHVHSAVFLKTLDSFPP